MRRWAKVVVCLIDGNPVEAVVPATSDVNMQRLLELAGGSSIRLAHEDELPLLFSDIEAGAMPPLGSLYGQTVFVDVALAGERDIVFDAGTHTDAISMRWTDFARIVKPIVGKFATRALESQTELPL
jgi:Ala-tRNA(Pro) deacylase